MAAPAPAAADEARVLHQIHDLVHRIEHKTTDLLNTIDRTLRTLPTAIAARIADGTERFLALLRQAYGALAEVLDTMGSPSTLWAHATAWSGEVGGPVSGLALDADLDHTQADDGWGGSAAEAYRNCLGPQKNALVAVKATLTDGIAAMLSEMARAILVFWGLLAAGLASLVAGVIGAIAASATIVGLPAGPFLAGSAALTFLAAFAGGVMNLRSCAADQNVRLMQKLNDNASFRHGHWPRSTADLSDGSRGDGSPSGWHLKDA
jgi:hypothetical protein